MPHPGIKKKYIKSRAEVMAESKKGHAPGNKRWLRISIVAALVGDLFWFHNLHNFILSGSKIY